MTNLFLVILGTPKLRDRGKEEELQKDTEKKQARRQEQKQDNIGSWKPSEARVSWKKEVSFMPTAADWSSQTQKWTIGIGIVEITVEFDKGCLGRTNLMEVDLRKWEKNSRQ